MAFKSEYSKKGAVKGSLGNSNLLNSRERQGENQKKETTNLSRKCISQESTTPDCYSLDAEISHSLTFSFLKKFWWDLQNAYFEKPRHPPAVLQVRGETIICKMFYLFHLIITPNSMKFYYSNFTQRKQELQRIQISSSRSQSLKEWSRAEFGLIDHKISVST